MARPMSQAIPIYVLFLGRLVFPNITVPHSVQMLWMNSETPVSDACMFDSTQIKHLYAFTP